MEEMRKQFEQWAIGRFGENYVQMDLSTGEYDVRFIQSHWECWKESRAALVVDIANHTEFEIEHMISPEKEGYSIGWIDGRNYSVKQVCAAGITVKGEGDE